MKNVLALRTTGCVLALFVAGVLANVSRADTVNGQPIYVQNNGSRPIWVAARYMPAGSTSYINDGYWKVEPGQKMLIVYNNAVWVYFHARDDLGRVWRGGGNHFRGIVRGESIDMYAVDTGNDYNSRVMTFFDR